MDKGLVQYKYKYKSKEKYSWSVFPMKKGDKGDRMVACGALEDGPIVEPVPGKQLTDGERSNRDGDHLATEILSH